MKDLLVKLKNYSNKIQMHGKNYAFNVNEILNFINNIEKTNTSEITEIWMNDVENENLELASKECREVKGGEDDSMKSIKYQILNTLIGMLERNELIESADDLDFLGKMAFNGLLESNLIKEVE